MKENVRTIKRLYVAGPITHDPEAKSRFESASALLKASGYEVINPLDIDPAEAFPDFQQLSCEEAEAAQLKADLIAMLQCGGVATLPMNHSSKGMARELAIAFSLDIPVYPVRAWIQGGDYGEA
jgi:nucleoside 2-deoxyribosyltransferase